MTLIAVETERATPASVEDACRWVVSPHPTFDQMLARYQDAIYRYALHLTGNREAADEVYQETVLTAYHEFNRLDESVNQRARLYQIATNAFLSNRPQHSKEGSPGEESSTFFRAATEAQLATSTLLAEVEARVVNLPVWQRLALILRMYHDLSYPEIAVTLDCSAATARTLVYQALRTLRDQFGERL